MTNVARHARASTCTVRLEARRRRAGGRGRRRRRRHRPPTSQAGVGLVALRERAAELGGRERGHLPTHGGTVVRAWLPLRRPRERARSASSWSTTTRSCARGSPALLGALDGIDVVGTAADGRDAVHVVAETAPDVVVMDIQMPHLDGIEATRMITGRQPGRPRGDADDERGRRDRARRDPRGRLAATCSRGPAPRRCSTRSARPRAGRHGVRGVAGRAGGGVLRRRAARPAEEPFPELTERERDGAPAAGGRALQRRHRRRALRVQQDGAQRGVRRSTPSCTPPGGPRRSSRRGRPGTGGIERGLTMDA